MDTWRLQTRTYDFYMSTRKKMTANYQITSGVIALPMRLFIKFIPLLFDFFIQIKEQLSYFCGKQKFSVYQISN